MPIVNYIRQYDEMRGSHLAGEAESLISEGYSQDEIMVILGLC